MGKDIIVKTKLGEYLVKDGLLYTDTDEWVKVEDDIATIGITDYAQKKLKYIVNIELPDVGSRVSKGDTVATLESVKTIADVYSPVNGEVIEVNETLLDNPDKINKDPYGDGWIVKIKIASKDQLTSLLSPGDYVRKIESEEK